MAEMQPNRGKMRSNPSKGLSEQTRKWLLGGSVGALVIVAAVWGGRLLTVVPPPSPRQASAGEVVGFLGNESGFARQSFDDREKYLADVWAQVADDQKRQELIQAFDEMNSSQRDAFVEALFDLFKDRFLKQASEYQNLPIDKRQSFVDGILDHWDEQFRAMNAGCTASGKSVVNSFDGALPATTDGMSRMIIERTTPAERSKGEPLFNALIVRYGERALLRHKSSSKPESSSKPG